MKPLEEFLAEQSEITIQALANYIEQYSQEHWQQELQSHQQELSRLFDQAGEPAYGAYNRTLWRPAQEQLKQARFLSKPPFPGTLSTSREWGPLQKRERWMWSVVRQAQGVPIGTIVIRFFHDHTQFRIPHPPGVLALEKTESNAIIEALSLASVHFKSAEA